MDRLKYVFTHCIMIGIRLLCYHIYTEAQIPKPFNPVAFNEMSLNGLHLDKHTQMK